MLMIIMHEIGIFGQYSETSSKNKKEEIGLSGRK